MVPPVETTYVYRAIEKIKNLQNVIVEMEKIEQPCSTNKRLCIEHAVYVLRRTQREIQATLENCDLLSSYADVSPLYSGPIPDPIEYGDALERNLFPLRNVWSFEGLQRDIHLISFLDQQLDILRKYHQKLTAGPPGNEDPPDSSEMKITDVTPPGRPSTYILPNTTEIERTLNRIEKNLNPLPIVNMSNPLVRQAVDQIAQKNANLGIESDVPPDFWKAPSDKKEFDVWKEKAMERCLAELVRLHKLSDYIRNARPSEEPTGSKDAPITLDSDSDSEGPHRAASNLANVIFDNVKHVEASQISTGIVAQLPGNGGFAVPQSIPHGPGNGRSSRTNAAKRTSGTSGSTDGEPSAKKDVYRALNPMRLPNGNPTDQFVPIRKVPNTMYNPERNVMDTRLPVRYTIVDNSSNSSHHRPAESHKGLSPHQIFLQQNAAMNEARSQPEKNRPKIPGNIGIRKPIRPVAMSPSVDARIRPSTSNLSQPQLIHSSATEATVQFPRTHQILHNGAPFDPNQFKGRDGYGFFETLLLNECEIINQQKELLSKNHDVINKSHESGFNLGQQALTPDNLSMIQMLNAHFQNAGPSGAQQLFNQMAGTSTTADGLLNNLNNNLIGIANPQPKMVSTNGTAPIPFGQPTDSVKSRRCKQPRKAPQSKSVVFPQPVQQQLSFRSPTEEPVPQDRIFLHPQSQDVEQTPNRRNRQNKPPPTVDEEGLEAARILLNSKDRRTHQNDSTVPSCSQNEQGTSHSVQVQQTNPSTSSLPANRNARAANSKKENTTTVIQHASTNPPADFFRPQEPVENQKGQMNLVLNQSGEHGPLDLSRTATANDLDKQKHKSGSIPRSHSTRNSHVSMTSSDPSVIKIEELEEVPEEAPDAPIGSGPPVGWNTLMSSGSNNLSGYYAAAGLSFMNNQTISPAKDQPKSHNGACSMEKIWTNSAGNKGVAQNVASDAVQSQPIRYFTTQASDQSVKESVIMIPQDIRSRGRTTTEALEPRRKSHDQTTIDHQKSNETNDDGAVAWQHSRDSCERLLTDEFQESMATSQKDTETADAIQRFQPASPEQTLRIVEYNELEDRFIEEQQLALIPRESTGTSEQYAVALSMPPPPPPDFIPPPGMRLVYIHPPVTVPRSILYQPSNYYQNNAVGAIAGNPAPLAITNGPEEELVEDENPPPPPVQVEEPEKKRRRHRRRNFRDILEDALFSNACHPRFSCIEFDNLKVDCVGCFPRSYRKRAAPSQPRNVVVDQEPDEVLEEAENLEGAPSPSKSQEGFLFKRGRPRKDELRWPQIHAVEPCLPVRKPMTKTRNNPNAPPPDSTGVQRERKPKRKSKKHHASEQQNPEGPDQQDSPRPKRRRRPRRVKPVEDIIIDQNALLEDEPAEEPVVAAQEEPAFPAFPPLEEIQIKEEEDDEIIDVEHIDEPNLLQQPVFGIGALQIEHLLNGPNPVAYEPAPMVKSRRPPKRPPVYKKTLKMEIIQYVANLRNAQAQAMPVENQEPQEAPVCITLSESPEPETSPKQARTHYTRQKYPPPEAPMISETFQSFENILTKQVMDVITPLM